MISEERKFCPYCKRPTVSIPCTECQAILNEYEPPNYWSYDKLVRYTELLFNRDFFRVVDILVKARSPNGMTFDQIHNDLVTVYTQNKLSQLLTSLMILEYVVQPIPSMYKFQLP